jgi:hypothetical protein
VTLRGSWKNRRFGETHPFQLGTTLAVTSNRSTLRKYGNYILQISSLVNFIQMTSIYGPMCNVIVTCVRPICKALKLFKDFCFMLCLYLFVRKRRYEICGKKLSNKCLCHAQSSGRSFMKFQRHVQGHINSNAIRVLRKLQSCVLQRSVDWR